MSEALRVTTILGAAAFCRNTLLIFDATNSTEDEIINTMNKMHPN